MRSSTRSWPWPAEEDGWAILLRDVSDSLLDLGRSTADERGTILRAVGRLHDAFRGERVDSACTVTDRLRFLGPEVMGLEAAGPEFLPRIVLASWDVFFEVVPADVGAAISAILADPASLGDQLVAGETTLIHGDLWPPNIGVRSERVILLDWALACQAPAEMEYASGSYGTAIRV